MAPSAKAISMSDRRRLEKLYDAYNRPRWRSSDPIGFVYRYPDAADREIVALVASSLAFGGIKQIMASVEHVLEALGPGPAGFVLGVSRARVARSLGEMRHRWITGEDLAGMLAGAGSAMKAYGSLAELFRSRLESADPDTGPAASRFAEEIRRRGGAFRQCLLPSTRSGSACKRLHLMFRWMVRSDEIDTGLWRGVPASLLLVPLDIHLHRFARSLELTRRKTADRATVREVTEAFRTISPSDPVKYDFALAHEGMRGTRIGVK